MVLLSTLAFIFESSYAEHQRLVNALEWSWIILGALAVFGWFMYFRLRRTFARHMEKEHGIPTAWYTPGHHARRDANSLLYFLYKRQKFLLKGCGYERRMAIERICLFKNDDGWYGPFLEFFIYVIHTLGCEIIIREQTDESIETCSEEDAKLILGQDLNSMIADHVPRYYSANSFLLFLSSVSLMALAVFFIILS